MIRKFWIEIFEIQEFKKKFKKLFKGSRLLETFQWKVLESNELHAGNFMELNALNATKWPGIVQITTQIRAHFLLPESIARSAFCFDLNRPD